MPQCNVLAVDDDSLVLKHLDIILKDHYNVHKAKTVKEALEIIKKVEIYLVLLDIDFGAGGLDGLQGLQEIKKIDDKITVVMLTATKTMDAVKQAITFGAVDYIRKPIDGNDLIFSLEKIGIKKKLEKENLVLKTRLDGYERNDKIISNSPVIRSMLDKIDRISDQTVNILITGETGTGKELVARRFNLVGNGSSIRPFVAVNCAAIPANLLESTLFGYEKSAFTGATKSSPGKFELADGGDIFLDEISSMDFELQAKLLRVIQEREVERVGGLRPKTVNFRVISASNGDLIEMMKQGKFREDLYYRINTVEINIPPLRERKEDIPLLADFFIRKRCGNKQIKRLSQPALQMLDNYNWPGNVRQLEQVITSAIILSKGEIIYPCDISLQPGGKTGIVQTAPSATPPTQNFSNSLAKMMADYERRLINEAIKRSRSVREAAKLLKTKPTTLYSKYAKYKEQKTI